MIAWLEWKRVNADKIAHVVGYEAEFVDKVLSRIPALSPSDVVPQYGFVDNNGKSRRIDFMIANTQKGYLLPIELDGLYKDDTHLKWNDFLTRQNDAILSFGTLLRYSNLQMKNNPDLIIYQISSQLAAQAARKSAEDQKKAIIEDFRVGSAVVSSVPSPPVPLPDKSENDNSRSIPKTVALASSVFLLGIATLAYFVWQNGAHPAAAIRENVVANAPANLREASQTPVATLGISRLSADPVTTSIPSLNETAQPSITTLGITPSPSDYIQASQASAYIGQHKRVCGLVAGWREISAGLFINFDRPYPNDAMSAVIWRDQLNKIGRPPLTDGQTICISGLIQKYRNKPQIEINHRAQISS